MKKAVSVFMWIMLFTPAVFLAAVWNRLPDIIPMQYGFDGEVNRYGSKTELVVVVAILTAVNIGVYLLMSNVHKIDPKRYAADNRERMKRLGRVICIFITAILCFIIYSSLNQSLKPKPQFILVGVGILFSFLGNYMFNIKPNYFAGFRLPWTLENEDNWRLTHNLAAKLWFGGGLLIVLCALVLSDRFAFISFIAIMCVLVIVPSVYSYRIFRKSRKP
jgi:uncharacterized membrane protein